MENRALLDTWGTFQKHCFYLVFLHRACRPPFLLDRYASGSATVSQFINIFDEEELQERPLNRVTFFRWKGKFISSPEKDPCNYMKI